MKIHFHLSFVGNIMEPKEIDSKETESAILALRTYAIGCFLDILLVILNLVAPRHLSEMKTLVSW